MLKPTQDINIFSLLEWSNHFKIIKVAKDLAINIINNDIAIEIPKTSGNLDGNANSPKTKNKPICIIQDNPSKKWNKLFLCGILLFPSIIPDI